MLTPNAIPHMHVTTFSRTRPYPSSSLLVGARKMRDVLLVILPPHELPLLVPAEGVDHAALCARAEQDKRSAIQLHTLKLEAGPGFEPVGGPISTHSRPRPLRNATETAVTYPWLDALLDVRGEVGPGPGVYPIAVRWEEARCLLFCSTRRRHCPRGGREAEQCQCDEVEVRVLHGYWGRCSGFRLVGVRGESWRVGGWKEGGCSGRGEIDREI